MESRRAGATMKITGRRKTGLGLIAGLVAACALAVTASPALALSNGGFETGNTKDWKRSSLGNGFWRVYSGPGEMLPPPPQGTYAAQAFQSGPSSNVLHRTLRLKKGVKHVLKMKVYYRNNAERFYTPASLSHTGAANQQYRIDLIKPKAKLRTMKPGKILTNIFRTKVGDRRVMRPKLVKKNISRFNGRKVRLRIAEVDNRGNFAAGVDAVKLVKR
ncbi:MAG TPA: hypothetical protein VK919_10635 [Solirubrobacterales bacterium]|nr:hypothetical protein [Solirubrobacterales bacterium]